MKHIKLFENYITPNNDRCPFKKNDTVVCNRNDLMLATYDGSTEKPEYGQYYVATKIDSTKQYILVKSMKTNNLLGYWSYTCFTPEHEWEAKKYNL